MTSLSGNSSGATTTTTTTSSDDSRKRKRMESNRESARRSRMRKQKLVDDLTTQLVDLKRENIQIAAAMSVAAKQFSNVEAENSVLRAQMAELSHRLDSLNEILSCINSCSTPPVAGGVAPATATGGDMMMSSGGGGGDGFMGTHMNNMGWMSLMNNHLPIMASSVDYCYDFGY